MQVCTCWLALPVSDLHLALGTRERTLSAHVAGVQKNRLTINGDGRMDFRDPPTTDINNRQKYGIIGPSDRQLRFVALTG